MRLRTPRSAVAAVHAGFTLVELLVAISIGLFLTGGLFTLVGAMKRTSVNQTGLSTLQDNERLSMTLLAAVIESAGYFPTPTLNTAASEFAAVTYATGFSPGGTPVTGALGAGQSVWGYGSYGAAAPADLISIRYESKPGDGLINCTGNTNTSAVNAKYINSFSIDANGNLQCLLIVNGVAQPVVTLVSGVTNLQIYYGVQTNTAVSGSSVDTYLDAPNVPNWGNVLSVKIKLTFTNPLAGQPGQAATIPFTRVITIMNRTGVLT